MTKRYTKKDVLNEYKKAVRRLQTFKQHTGMEYSIDKDAILASPNRKKAVAYLKSIKWSNIGKDKGKGMFKHIQVTAIGHLPKGKIKETKLTQPQGEELTKTIKQREKITGEKIKVNMVGSPEKAQEYYGKMANKEAWKEYKEARDTRAWNNYKNNINRIISLSNDPLTQAAAIVALKYINDGTLTLNKVKANKDLYEIAEINLFDSNDDATLVMGAESIMTALTANIPIDVEEIKQELKSHGYSDETIEELISFI